MMRPKVSGSAARGRPGQVAFLYEDDALIVVDKPAGLPTIAPDGGRGRNLYDIVTARIQRRNPKGRAAVVHRLDRDTSGVVVFARDARTKTRLMGAWDTLVTLRRYVAVVEGAMPAAEGLLDSWLAEAGPARMVEVAPGARGALRALTRYRVLASGPVFSLLELDLETGRKHQIRVQLAGAGHPVAGDRRYGARGDPLGRLALHAAVLELAGGPDGAPRRFESPAPGMFASIVGGGASIVGGGASVVGGGASVVGGGASVVGGGGRHGPRGEPRNHVRGRGRV